MTTKKACNKVKFNEKSVCNIVYALMHNAYSNIKLYSIHIKCIDENFYKVTVYSDKTVYMYIEFTLINNYIAVMCVNYLYCDCYNITHSYIDVFECDNMNNSIHLESTLTGEIINV